MTDVVGNFGFLNAGSMTELAEWLDQGLATPTDLALLEQALIAGGLEDEPLFNAIGAHNDLFLHDPKARTKFKHLIAELFRQTGRKDYLWRAARRLGNLNLFVSHGKLFPKVPLGPFVLRGNKNQSIAVSPAAGLPNVPRGQVHQFSGSKEMDLVSGPSDPEETKATPESLYEVVDKEFKRVRERYLGIQPSLPEEVQEKYSEELSKIGQKLTFWVGAIVSYLDEKKGQEKERFKEDILIGQRILLSRVLQLGAAVFSEPIDETSLTSVGLRSAPWISARQKPSLPEIEKIPEPKGKILPALINHDIGFGRTLALRPHQIIAINKLRGLLRLRKEGPAMNGAVEELLRGTVVMPVGGGKTRVMVAGFALAIEEGLFSADRGDKFVVLNHTEQIHEQNKEVMELLGPYFQKRFGRNLKISEYKADNKDLSGDVVIVSIPTINTEERRREFERRFRETLGEEGKIVMAAVDEIHHLELGKGKSKESWQEAVKVLRSVSPNLYRIGFTATPTGKEGPYIIRIRELDLMRAGVTPRTYLVRVEGEDLSKLKVSEQATDFQTGALVSVLLEFPERNRRLYEALDQKGIRREDQSPSGKEKLEGVLGFSADVRHAQMMARGYVEYFGPPHPTLSLKGRGATHSPSPLEGEGRGEGLKGRTLKIIGDGEGGISPRVLSHAIQIYDSGDVDALIAVVSQKTSPALRQRILDLVAEGKIEAAFNVGIWMEGADLWMFAHLLGAKPTFSRFQKGQERGRLNRRGPDDVSPRGELLSDKPKILFDVIDQYHGERSLIRYGDMMGVRGHTSLPAGALFDAMAEQKVEGIDKEGRAVTHRDLGEMMETKRGIPKPSTEGPQEALVQKLWEIFESQYAGDVETMAQDLGIPIEEMEQILQGQGWINTRWFLRRLATLLYQDREILVDIFNEERGLSDEKVTSADIQILRSALAVYYEWEGVKEGKIKIEEEIVISDQALRNLALGTITDRQWRNTLRGLLLYFGLQAQHKSQKQTKAGNQFNALNQHLFLREGWRQDISTAQERLLLEARQGVGLKFGGRLPYRTQIEGVSVQNPEAFLSRWLKGEKISFVAGVSPSDFYSQIRSLLLGLDIGRNKVDELIQDAVFEQERWERDESTAQKRLLLETRMRMALKFGGRFPSKVGIEGVPKQETHSALTRWLKDKRTKYRRNLSYSEFYGPLRSLLVGLDVSEKEADALIIDAVFEEQNWGRKNETPQQRLLLEARKGVALKLGGKLPSGSSISGVPSQSPHSQLTRWIEGKVVKYSTKYPSHVFYSQVASLLKGLGIDKNKADTLIIDSVFEEQNWGKEDGTCFQKLLLMTRKTVALKFGGRFPSKVGIEGVPKQDTHSALSRFLSGEPVQLTPSLLSQIRALLLHGNTNTPEEVEGWINGAQDHGQGG